MRVRLYLESLQEALLSGLQVSHIDMKCSQVDQAWDLASIDLHATLKSLPCLARETKPFAGQPEVIESISISSIKGNRRPEGSQRTRRIVKGEINQTEVVKPFLSLIHI